MRWKREGGGTSCCCFAVLSVKGNEARESGRLRQTARERRYRPREANATRHKKQERGQERARAREEKRGQAKQEARGREMVVPAIF